MTIASCQSGIVSQTGARVVTVWWARRPAQYCDGIITMALTSNLLFVISAALIYREPGQGGVMVMIRSLNEPSRRLWYHKAALKYILTNLPVPYDLCVGVPI